MSERMKKVLAPGWDESAWIAFGKPGSGMIKFDGKEFTAERSLESYFSGLGKGRRGAMGSPKDENGNLRPEIFLLAAVRSKVVAPVFAKRCRMAFYMSGKMEWADWELLQDPEAFDDFAGSWFVRLARDSQNGVAVAAKWLELIEENIRPATDAEDDFLSSVIAAASDHRDVPTQVCVREIWLSKDCDRAEDSFNLVRDAIGFDWLPRGRAGRKRGV